MTRSSEPGKPSPKTDRDQRRAAALRANLQRRKAQERGRTQKPGLDKDKEG